MTLFDSLPPDEVSRIGVRAAVVVPKAAVGPGVAMFNWGTAIGAFSKSPQKAMREAQELYHTNPWVRSAEATVTRRVVGLPWHLEDENNEEPEGEPTGAVKTATDLLEKPQANVDVGRKMTRRGLWAITTRHIGLCGMGYWYLDQLDGFARTPLSILYVNPARVWPAEDDAGNLTGWIIDPKDETGRGGTPLALDELIPFYLDEPDSGNLGTGLAEVAALKARITNLADMHAAYLLSTGGRLAGIVSPKEGSIPDDKFQALVREFRNLVEAPDAAKRTTILQGPVDFTPTAANPSELNLLDLSKMNRDDIFAIWGVPPSQAGVAGQGIGLNSGETRKYEEQILMQGAVHDRVVVLRETIQYQILDRWQKLGATIELEIEEPQFNDDAPAYEMAAKARDLPLTNKERRELIGLDPFGNPEIDEAVWLPVGLSEAYPGGEAGPQSAPPPKPVPPALAAAQPPMPVTPEMAAKSRIGMALTSAHDRYTKRAQADLQKAIDGVLEEQRAEVSRKVAKNDPGRLKDTSSWWDQAKWDRRLMEVMRAHYTRTYQEVGERVASVFATGKAREDDVDEGAVRRIVAEMMGRAEQPQTILTMPIHVAAPIVNMTAQMPEQKAAEVTVNVPEQRPPDVTVHVAAPAPTPAPIVNVHVPEVKAADIINVRIIEQPEVRKVVKRGPDGKITEVLEQ
jgi:phage portal protein BeeE